MLLPHQPSIKDSGCDSGMERWDGHTVVPNADGTRLAAEGSPSSSEQCLGDQDLLVGPADFPVCPLWPLAERGLC